MIDAHFRRPARRNSRNIRCLLWTCVAALTGVVSEAWAVPTCTIASSPTISFGSFAALRSTGDQFANSGTSFWVNCTSDVTSAPTLYSASTRTMSSGVNQLPFTLSLSPSMSSGLPSTAPGEALSIARDGTSKTVTLYGRLASADFRVLPHGLYTTMVTLNLDY
jgi:spore coat protein U-like protein